MVGGLSSADCSVFTWTCSIDRDPSGDFRLHRVPLLCCFVLLESEIYLRQDFLLVSLSIEAHSA